MKPQFSTHSALLVIVALLICKQSFSQASFTWEKQYDPLLIDVNGDTLKSTEVVDIVSHKGKAFAATSNWNDTADPFNGQILVKDNAQASWRLDAQTPGKISRASSILSVVFNTDKNGQNMINPDTMLFAGLTTHRGGSTNPNYPGKVAWRNDVTSTWTYKVLDSTQHPFNRTEVRSLGFHRDAVTNVDMIFAGATPAPLGIFAGRYDTALPDKIEWDTVAEFLPFGYERILGFAECNGVLYAATKCRILKRNDGVNVVQRWETLINFSLPQYMQQYAGNIYPTYLNDEDIRSFRNYIDNNGQEQLMFTTFNRLFLYDPTNNILTEETNIQQLLNTLTGRQYNYIQSGIITDVGLPDGSTVQLIGIEAIFDTVYLQQNPCPAIFGIDTRGLIIERKQDQNGNISYSLIVLSDLNFPGDTLTRVRTICNSPLSSEPYTIYTGGFASWGNPVQNTGWIYKGVVQWNSSVSEEHTLQASVFPNPCSDVITFSGSNITEVRLFDITGKLMLSKVVNADYASLDVSLFSTGTYLAEVRSDSGIECVRIIKK